MEYLPLDVKQQFIYQSLKFVIMHCTRLVAGLTAKTDVSPRLIHYEPVPSQRDAFKWMSLFLCFTEFIERLL